MNTRLDARTDDQRRAGRRAIVAASIGNAFEWYDFTVYAFFAVYFAKVFFPGKDPTTQLLEAFLVFGVGFVVRPLGALLLGAYGDVVGRKSVLTMTVLMMAGGTGILAVAPGYAAIGIGAPLLLLAGRMLQGFSAGGQIGAASSLLSEHAPPGRRGEFVSWIQATMAFSNVMGALVGFTVSTLLTHSQLEEFGWRLPFAFGLLIAPIGLWIRSSVDETPEFQRELELRKQTPATPLKTLLTKHPAALLRGIGVSVLLTVSSYSLVIFMPSYVQKTWKYSPTDAFAAQVVSNTLMVAFCVLAGMISDRIGRRAVLMASTVWLVLLGSPLLWLMGAHHDLPTLILVETLLCVGVGGFVGVAPPTLAEMFPAAVRASGVSLSYTIAVTVFSGFAPFVLTWLAAKGGVYAPAWYVILAAVLALPALLSLKRGAGARTYVAEPEPSPAKA